MIAVWTCPARQPGAESGHGWDRGSVPQCTGIPCGYGNLHKRLAKACRKCSNVWDQTYRRVPQLRMACQTGLVLSGPNTRPTTNDLRYQSTTTLGSGSAAVQSERCAAVVVDCSGTQSTNRWAMKLSPLSVTPRQRPLASSTCPTSRDRQ